MNTFDIEISKDEKYSIYASLGLLVAGYILAVVICDPLTFARFGSLIVSVGVIFGVKGLPHSLDAVQPIYERRLQKLRDEIESACQGHPFETHIRDTMAEKVEPEIVRLEQEMKRSLFSVKNRLLRIEGAIVIIGTLVWGFGDLLVPCVTQLYQKAG